MIDYEKLAQAHALAAQMDCRCSIEVAFFKYGSPRFIFNANNENDSFAESSIDDFLAKLCELTEPEPKYKIGDTVFHSVHWNRLFESKIETIISDEQGFVYTLSNCPALNEDYLFPTRQALIEHQINYWQSMLPSDPLPLSDGGKGYASHHKSEHINDAVRYLNPHTQSNQAQVDIDRCQHEGVKIDISKSPATARCPACGELRCANGQCANMNCLETWKCIKCGEFYR